MSERVKKWTPGPWVPRYHDRVATPDDTDGTKSIAHLYSYRDYPNRHRANQALVASAPDLVGAIESALEDLKSWERTYGDAGTQGVIEVCESALAMAYGETQ